MSSVQNDIVQGSTDVEYGEFAYLLPVDQNRNVSVDQMYQGTILRTLITVFEMNRYLD